MLEELLATEAELRTKLGEQVTVDAYLQRFQKQDETVIRALGRSGAVPPDFATPPTEDLANKTWQPSSKTGGDTVSLDDNRGGVVPAVNHPSRFAGFELLRSLGQGGMGVVYLAKQTKLNRLVALKMISRGEFASRADVQRFFAEAEAAAQLDHAGIVPVFEVGESNGQPFFAMAYVEGESLDKRLKDGPLPSGEAAKLLLQIADAVEYAHGRGIIHRDLKPANVLLDENGRPRVTDFGLAKRLGGDSDMTTTGQILGTPSFMPPEQARGDLQAIGVCSDVYSLGAILYTMLTGRPPFRAAGVAETLQQVLEHEPAPPGQLNPAVDRDLETICLHCLEKDVQRRYASAAELAAELRRWLADEPIHARRPSPLERAWRWTRRNRVVAALGAAVMVALVAMSVAWWTHSNAQRVKRVAELQQQFESSLDRLSLSPQSFQEGESLAASLGAFDPEVELDARRRLSKQYQAAIEAALGQPRLTKADYQVIDAALALLRLRDADAAERLTVRAVKRRGDWELESEVVAPFASTGLVFDEPLTQAEDGLRRRCAVVDGCAHETLSTGQRAGRGRLRPRLARGPDGGNSSWRRRRRLCVSLASPAAGVARLERFRRFVLSRDSESGWFTSSFR